MQTLRVSQILATTRSLLSLLIFSIFLARVSHLQAVPPQVDDAVEGKATLDPSVEFTPDVTPTQNFLTPPQTSRAEVLLGKALFWDEQLSSTNTVACGTCHIPSAGGSDPRTLGAIGRWSHPGKDGVLGTDDDSHGSLGVHAHTRSGERSLAEGFGLLTQLTPRRPRSVLNADLFPRLFWDARADRIFVDPLSGEMSLDTIGALEVQALQPILNSAEMSYPGRSWPEVVSKLASSRALALAARIPAELSHWIRQRHYPLLFEEAFGDHEITPERIARAIASYERTLIADQAPILRRLAGIESPEEAAMWTSRELRGLDVFMSSDCNQCHPMDLMFSDLQSHFIGLRPAADDPGIGAITDNPSDRGLFQTPSLLNVSLRAPFFHDGSKRTLFDVVNFYRRGGDHRGAEIRRLRLSGEEMAALVAFLSRPLTDPRLLEEQPPFDRPLLSTETVLGALVVNSSVDVEPGRYPKIVVESSTLSHTLSGGPVTLLSGGGVELDGLDSNTSHTLALPLHFEGDAYLDNNVLSTDDLNVLRFTAALSGAGVVLLQSRWGGALELAADNTLSGLMVVRHGHLRVAHSGAFGDTTRGTRIERSTVEFVSDHHSEEWLFVRGDSQLRGSHEVILDGPVSIEADSQLRVEVLNPWVFGGTLRGRGRIVITGWEFDSLTISGDDANTLSDWHMVSGEIHLNKPESTPAIAGEWQLGGEQGELTVHWHNSGQLADDTRATVDGPGAVWHLDGHNEELRELHLNHTLVIDCGSSPSRPPLRWRVSRQTTIAPSARLVIRNWRAGDTIRLGLLNTREHPSTSDRVQFEWNSELRVGAQQDRHGALVPRTATARF